MKFTQYIFIFVIFSLALGGCVSTSTPITSLSTSISTPTPTPTTTNTLQPTTPRPTAILIRPKPSPTPLAGASGYLLGAGVLRFSLDANRNPALDDIKEIDLKTKETKILLSASDLEGKLPPDVLNPNSYSYIVSPNAGKALINICTAFDPNGCITESFIVDFETKDIKEINEVRKVFWEWSPDGSKLAGIQLDNYGFPIATYVIDNDGANLIKIDEGSFQLFWSTDSQTIYSIKITQDSKTVFGSIKTDGTGHRKIEVEGLSDGNYLEAIDFSNDGKKVAYKINDSFVDPKLYKLYIANYDFTDSEVIYESDTVSQGVVSSLSLSPDNNYIIDSGSEEIPSVIDVNNGNLVSLPSYENLYICGWAPDNSLVYVTSPTPEELGFQSQLWLLSLANPVIDVPYGKLVECPVSWISDSQVITVSANSLVTPDTSNQHTEACYPHPGTDYQDAPDPEIPGQLDILNISSSLDNNNQLTVTIKLREVPDQIIKNDEIINKSETDTYYYNIGLDVDNNSKTGLERSGMDGQDAALLGSIFQVGDTVYGGIFIIRTYADSSSSNDSEIIINKDASTITFSGKIPGVKLTTNAVLNIASYSEHHEGDSLCD